MILLASLRASARTNSGARERVIFRAAATAARDDVAARMVCAADWAALPWANRPYGRRQLPEHAMSVPSKRSTYKTPLMFFVFSEQYG